MQAGLWHLWRTQTIHHWNYAENDNKNGNRNLSSLFRELGLERYNAHFIEILL